MQVIKGSFYHITGIYEVINQQFSRLLNNR